MATPTPRRLRVGSLNIAKENRAPRVGLLRFLTKVDVAGLQEVETVLNRATLSAVARLSGRRVFWPGSTTRLTHGGARYGTPANAVPIVYNPKRVELTGWITYKVNDGQRGNFPNRYFAVAVFRDKKTGDVFRFGNTHMVPGAFSGRLPQNRNDWTHAASTIETAAHAFRARPLVIAADWNRPKFSLDGMHGRYAAAPTHGRSFYDGFQVAGCDVVNLHIVYANGSDHLGVLGEIDF